MAEAVVSFAGKRLGELLVREAVSLSEVGSQVEELKDELNRIRCFLKDVDRRQDKSESLRNLVSEIREVAYCAEDVVDALASKQELRSNGLLNVLGRYCCIFKEWIELHQTRSTIETIKSKISALRASLQTHALTQTSAGEGSSSRITTQRDLRRSYSHIKEDIVVGFEDDTEKLVKELVDKSILRRVVAICAMGGSGKTTLAKKIYHHQEIRRNFDCFAWVYVSQQVQRGKVWKEILYELIPPSPEVRNEILENIEGEVTKRLYQVLQERKCLVILDDIWTQEAWDLLSPAFPPDTAATGSKILLTTRNREVPLHADSKGFAAFIHDLQRLNEEESWELFQKKAFSRGIEPGAIVKAKMEELGRNMVRKCGGLPLAIVVLGGLLSTKYLYEWEMMHNDILRHLRVGNTHEENFSGVAQVLALSYYDLPYRLKHCFLYLSHFPQDFEIRTEKLIQMWVAEGFVPENQGETMEDVGMHYLNELIARCMVQVGKVKLSGRIKTCRLHDLMRDMCMSIAEEENFFKIIKYEDGDNQIPTAMPVHRLAILSCGDDYDISEKIVRYKRNYNLRSFVLYDAQFQPILFEFLTLSLRVLNLESSLIDFELNFGKLINLRFLSFRGNLLEEQFFQSSFGSLQCLQTLDLRSDDLQGWKIPDVIWMMKQLRHLYLPGFGYTLSAGKLQLGNLRSLQTLVNLIAFPGVGREVATLTDLRKLEIIFESREEFLQLRNIFDRPNVIIFNHLRFLSFKDKGVAGYFLGEMESMPDFWNRIFVSCPHLYKMYAGACLGDLPSDEHFPLNITELSLQCSFLERDPMSMLEKLPCLKILQLLSDSFLGKEMVCSRQGFPQLKSLVLSYLDLEEWRVEEEAMPSLRHLKISSCRSLRNIPDGLRFITTLEQLEIQWMPEGFVSRIIQGGDDFYKVQHVPSITYFRTITYFQTFGNQPGPP